MRFWILCTLTAFAFAQSTQSKELNAVSFFKRASEHLVQGHEVQALNDFKKALNADPKFLPAQQNLASVYLRLGYVDKAIEAAEQCKDLKCQETLQNAQHLKQLLFYSPSEVDDCNYYTQLLEIAPKSVDILKQRAQCNLERGSAIEALSDLTLVVQINPQDVKTTAQVAVGTFLLLDQRKQAMQILRRCATYNEVSTECQRANKQLRKVQKMADLPILKLKLNDIIAESKQLLMEYNLHWEDSKHGVLVENLQKRKCHALVKKQDWKKCSKICAQVRDFDESYPPAILAQAHLEKSNNNRAQAMELVKQILHEHSDSDIADLASQLRDEIMMEQRRPPPQRQQQPSKDLYKVLGVDENADKREIRRAYRELSKRYHPDKYKGKDMTEDEVMAKMQEINEAYETLTNDESRQDYDQQRNGDSGSFGGAHFADNFNGFGGFGGDPFAQFFAHRGGGF